MFGVRYIAVGGSVRRSVRRSVGRSLHPSRKGPYLLAYCELEARISSYHAISNRKGRVTFSGTLRKLDDEY